MFLAGPWVAPPPCLSCPLARRVRTSGQSVAPRSAFSRQVHIHSFGDFPHVLLLTLRKISFCSHSVVHVFLLLFCCYCSTLQHCFPLNVGELYRTTRGSGDRRRAGGAGLSGGTHPRRPAGGASGPGARSTRWGGSGMRVHIMYIALSTRVRASYKNKSD